MGVLLSDATLQTKGGLLADQTMISSGVVLADGKLLSNGTTIGSGVYRLPAEYYLPMACFWQIESCWPMDY